MGCAELLETLASFFIRFQIYGFRITKIGNEYLICFHPLIQNIRRAAHEIEFRIDSAATRQHFFLLFRKFNQKVIEIIAMKRGLRMILMSFINHYKCN